MIRVTDLVEFLIARLDERQVLAEAASWSDDSNVWLAGQNVHDQRWYVVDSMEEGVLDRVHAHAADDAAVAKLVAANDPAFVLADVAAKRRILARHRVPTKSEWQRWHARMCLGCGTMGEFDDPRVREINECPELRDLASPYAEHADFQPEWRLRD